MEDMVRYLDEVVDPTIAELERDPTSVRRAFLACVAAFHAIDYLAYPRKSAAQREIFRRECKSFAIVDRVAHAFKHVKAGDPKSSTNRPLLAQNVISRPGALWAEGFTWDLSRWDDPIGGVTLNEEQDVDLLAELKNTVEFLRSQI
jgi:hypothetical protein